MVGSFWRWESVMTGMAEAIGRNGVMVAVGGRG